MYSECTCTRYINQHTVRTLSVKSDSRIRVAVLCRSVALLLLSAPAPERKKANTCQQLDIRTIPSLDCLGVDHAAHIDGLRGVLRSFSRMR